MIITTIIIIGILVWILYNARPVEPREPVESISLEQALRDRGWLDE